VGTTWGSAAVSTGAEGRKELRPASYYPYYADRNLLIFDPFVSRAARLGIPRYALRTTVACLCVAVGHGHNASLGSARFIQGVLKGGRALGSLKRFMSFLQKRSFAKLHYHHVESILE
jgi:hypothetical protein